MYTTTTYGTNGQLRNPRRFERYFLPLTKPERACPFLFPYPQIIISITEKKKKKKIVTKKKWDWLPNQNNSAFFTKKKRQKKKKDNNKKKRKRTKC